MYNFLYDKTTPAKPTRVTYKTIAKQICDQCEPELLNIVKNRKFYVQKKES